MCYADGMELTPDEAARILQWFAYAENEGAMSAYGVESDALVNRLSELVER